MKLLDENPELEVACRRRHLQQLPSSLQWGEVYGAAGLAAFDMATVFIVKDDHSPLATQR